MLEACFIKHAGALHRWTKQPKVDKSAVPKAAAGYEKNITFIPIDEWKRMSRKQRTLVCCAVVRSAKRNRAHKAEEPDSDEEQSEGTVKELLSLIDAGNLADRGYTADCEYEDDDNEHMAITTPPNT